MKTLGATGMCRSACVVALWWTALHKQCILTPLNKVQRMAAFFISGVLQNTPNDRWMRS